MYAMLATNPLSYDGGAKRSHSGLKPLIPKEQSVDQVYAIVIPWGREEEGF